MRRALVDEISLPHGWTRNRGIEASMARPLCLEHQSLAAFVDVAPHHCTEGIYESPPDAVMLVKGYRPHEQFEGFECCIQRPIFCIADADRIVAVVTAVVEEQSHSKPDRNGGN